MDLLNSTSDLMEVFVQLQEIGKNKSGGGRIFKIFFPIRPMLAGKMSNSQLSNLTKSREVLVETKFDGERI